MSAEFFLNTKPNTSWAYENQIMIEAILRGLDTYRGFSKSYDSYVLVDTAVLWSEERSKSGKVIPNVYFHFNNEILMLMINSLSVEITIDIDKFIKEVQHHTDVIIVDDDDELLSWNDI